MAFRVSAETFYFTHTALGGQADSPSTATNFTWFNTAGNWGSGAGKISAGDTVYLVGTVATNLTFQGGGTPGSPVTLIFYTGAQISAPALSGNIINLNGNCNIVIDGGATGLIGGYTGNTNLANGWIVNTANGTGLANSNDCTGVFAQQSTNVVIQNLAFMNLYQRTAGDEGNGYGAGVISRWNGGVSPSLTTVSNCLFGNMSVGFSTSYGPLSHSYLMTRCTAWLVNWGGNAGDHGSSSTMTNLVVSYNYFHSFTNWDQAANTYHHNGYYAWAESGGTLGDVTMFGNVIRGGFSFGSPNNQTAGLFVSGPGAKGTNLIYNNLFIQDTDGNPPSNGHIFIWPGSNSVNRIYNNTFIGRGGNGIQAYGANSISGQTFDIQNNLGTNCTFINVAYSGAITLTATNNHGSGLTSGQAYSYSTTSSSSFRTLQQWQTLGFDTAATNTNPKVSAVGALASDSPVIGIGTVLNSLFTKDGAGTTRGAAWDLGWLEYAAEPTVPSSTFGGRITFGGKVVVQ